MQSNTRPLPEGWRWVRIGEVCDVVNGFGFAEHLQGRRDLSYPYVKVSDMNTGGAETVVTGAANTVDDSILKSLGARTFPPGTVIFPKVGGALLTNKKRILGVEASFDNNVMGLVPKNVESWWLYFWMLNFDLRTLSNTQALPSIRQSEVAAVAFPLPPLEEQKRIVAILKEQIAVVEQARAAAEAQLEAATTLPAAYLRMIFDSPESGRWQTVPLEQVCEKITDGTHRSPPNGKEGIPYITAKNIRPFTFDLTELTYVSPEAHQEIYKRCDPRMDDVLYIKDGATMGIATVNRLPYEFSMLSSVALIRTKKRMLLPDFLACWLNSPRTYRGVRDAELGSAIKRMVLGQIATMLVPLPPLVDQQRIATMLNEQMASAECTRKAIEEELDTINRLPAALLRRAFSGEL